MSNTITNTSHQSITNKLNHAARFSVSPVFSLFGVDSMGRYTLVTTDSKADNVASQFQWHASNGTYQGLEVRCDGVRVSL